MDFLSQQALLFTSKKYENIYKLFNDKYGIKYQELFLLCASLGFKYHRLSCLQEKGRELRSNYFNTKQRVSAYTMILCDPELGRNIYEFENSEFILKARKKIEQYAEGGMDILVESVFGGRWNGFNLDETYSEYEVDILSYLYEVSAEIPF